MIHGGVTIRDAVIGVILLIPTPAAAIMLMLLRRRARLKRATPLQGGLAQAFSYAVLWVFMMMFITGLDFLGLHVWLIDHRRPSTYLEALLLVVIQGVLYFFAMNAFQKPPVIEDWLLWDKDPEQDRDKR
jgi:hypothetical protein